MRSEIPIFRQIKLDFERSARELQVFWAAAELLDVVDERAMTVMQLQTEILRQQREVRGKKPPEVSRSTIAHALQQLEIAGYLMHSEHGYRVPLSRAPALSALPEHGEPRRVRSRVSGVVSEAL